MFLAKCNVEAVVYLDVSKYYFPLCFARLDLAKDLYNAKDNTVGVAYSGTMCEGQNSLSITEFTPNGKSVTTVAHELGHR